MIQTFVESCLDFEVAHLSVLMVQRLPYPEIPTLRSDCSHSYWRLDFHISISQHTREGISCAEAILATQETITWYMSGGNKVYMCLYDLNLHLTRSSILSFQLPNSQ